MEDIICLKHRVTNAQRQKHRGRRLDSATKKTATEIERNRQNIAKAVSRLKDSGRPRKVLQVPQPLFKDAVSTMRKKGVRGTVKNLSGTKRTSVR